MASLTRRGVLRLSYFADALWSCIFSVARVLGMSVAAGCSTNSQLDKPLVVSSIQQAATVHLAPLSVSRWEDMVANLQPQYTITPAQAVTLALPRTFVSQASAADLFSAQLQLGLPQSTSTTDLAKALTNGVQSNTTGASNASTNESSNLANGTSASGRSSTGATSTTSTVATNNGATTTQTTTTQQGPGVLPPNLLPSAALPSATALLAPTGTTALDPMLTYQAATAVYQEIELLNNYVNDAVMQYGYVPYVARVQVSIAPKAHNEPYDVYIDLAFASRCRGRLQTHPVIVIPLLVTDDVETGQSSSAVDNARQLAASLGGMTGNVALQAGLSQLKNDFNAILGTDFNSLYMVTRSTDNVLQVRLGAARSTNPNVKYSMLTQTHNVSFLMLVDQMDAATDTSADCFKYPPDLDSFSFAWDAGDASKQGPQVWISSYTRMRNAVTGTELPVDRGLIQQHALEVLHRLQPPDHQTPIGYQSIAPLLADIQQDSTESFSRHLCVLLKDLEPPEGKTLTDKERDDLAQKQAFMCERYGGSTAQAAWAGLASIVNMSEFAGANFALPLRRTLGFEKKQSLYLHDNCKDTATVTIAGRTPMAPSQFTATLKLPGNLLLEATSITQPTANGPFVVKFPSLYPFRNLKTDKSTREASEEDVFTVIDHACPSKEAQDASAAAAKTADAAEAEAAKKASVAAATAKAADLALSRLQPGKDASPKPSTKTGDTGAPNAASKNGAESTGASSQAQPAAAGGTSGVDSPAVVAARKRAADAKSAANEAKAASVMAQTKAKAAKQAASTLAPLTLLSSAHLTLRQIGDGRWARTESVSYLFDGGIYYDGAASQPNFAISITAANDTVSLTPGSTNPTGASLRLFVIAGKDLADFVLSFNGGSLVSVPTLPSGSTYVQAVESLQTPAQVPATLKVTPPNGSAFDPTTPVVMDINLQGLIPARALTITATGHDANKVAQGNASVVLPIMGPASSNNPPGGQQGTPGK